MSLEDWHTVLAPKVQGTINLHEALINEPLDFFVMTSSTLGTIGSSTQSNYAAANAFLDSMARHRWSMGLQACSIALGMIIEVGHVEAHPEVKEAFQQRNVYGTSEDEYLKMMEVACCRRDPNKLSSYECDPYATSHVVTGMEPGKIANSVLQSSWATDPRFSHLVKIANTLHASEYSPNSKIHSTISSQLRAASTNGLSSVYTAVHDLVLQQLSKLVGTSTKKLKSGVKRPLSDYGMDSMVTAELRGWMWRELGAEVPFMVLLEGGISIEELVKLVWEHIDHSVWKI